VEELRAIQNEIFDVLDLVEKALDEYAAHSQRLDAGARVEDLVRRYHAFVAGLTPEAREEANRTVGRAMLDLQKRSSGLPRPAQGSVSVEVKTEREFWERRAPSSSIAPVQPGVATTQSLTGFRVGGPATSWCGKCGELRAHTISAMVSGEPAQVVCDRCGGRHKYKPQLPKSRGRKDEPRAGAQRGRGPVNHEADRRAREQKELLDTIHAAANVRAFDPRERCRTGEVIAHPEHGRGVVETAMPRSLMVRFSTGRKLLQLA
jgi:hypothetical protein